MSVIVRYTRANLGYALFHALAGVFVVERVSRYLIGETWRGGGVTPSVAAALVITMVLLCLWLTPHAMRGADGGPATGAELVARVAIFGIYAGWLFLLPAATIFAIALAVEAASMSDGQEAFRSLIFGSLSFVAFGTLPAAFLGCLTGATLGFCDLAIQEVTSGPARGDA